MPQKERYFEHRTSSHCFRNPALSETTSLFQGERGREFLAVGQRVVLIFTSDPQMGGGSYTKLHYKGRVGVIDSDDAGQAYAYIHASDAKEDMSVVEMIPGAKAEAFLEDPEACGKFVTRSLQAALEISDACGL